MALSLCLQQPNWVVWHFGKIIKKKFSLEVYNLAGLVSTQQFGLALNSTWSRKPCSTTFCISFVLYKNNTFSLATSPPLILWQLGLAPPHRGPELDMQKNTDGEIFLWATFYFVDM